MMLCIKRRITPCIMCSVRPDCPYNRGGPAQKGRREYPWATKNMGGHAHKYTNYRMHPQCLPTVGPMSSTLWSLGRPSLRKSSAKEQDTLPLSACAGHITLRLSIFRYFRRKVCQLRCTRGLRRTVLYRLLTQVEKETQFPRLPILDSKLLGTFPAKFMQCQRINALRTLCQCYPLYQTYQALKGLGLRVHDYTSPLFQSVF